MTVQLKTCPELICDGEAGPGRRRQSGWLVASPTGSRSQRSLDIAYDIGIKDSDIM